MAGELDALLGLGEQSFRKSYYPELQHSLAQFEQEREKFHTIFNNSIQLIGLLDTRGVLLEANKRALDLIKARPEAVIGKPFWDTPWWQDNPEGSARLRSAFAAALEGRIPRFETTHPDAASQGELIVEFTITPIRNAAGEVVLLIPEGRDITERKTAEAEKITALSQLVVGISHEINTPLGVSLTAASYMGTRLAQLSRELQDAPVSGQMELAAQLANLQQAANLVERNLERMAALIQSFKHISADQIDDRQRQFDLKTYLQDIRHSVAGLLESGKHQFILECPAGIYMHSYPGALSQVLSQLVINSIHHGFAGTHGGSISLRVTPAPPLVHLDYHDSGRGIPPEVRSHIFEPFFTTDRANHTGLGLNVVYNIVNTLLRGEISLPPGEPAGTLFRLSLPLEV